MSLCAKPGCTRAGAAVLSFDYARSLATLEDPPEGEVSPHYYLLCAPCAEKLTPPRGWLLDDERTRPPLFLERLEERAEAARYPQEPHDPAETERVTARQVFFGHSA